MGRGLKVSGERQRSKRTPLGCCGRRRKYRGEYGQVKRVEARRGEENTDEEKVCV